MELKFVQRGYQDNLVLIPGWATDYRIFGPLDLPYNYLFPLDFSPFNFAQELRGELEKNSRDMVSLLGWSMGGFLAADFCAAYPESVTELILLGVRKRYQPAVLREINTKLARNKMAWLAKFYQGLFAKEDAQGWRWFKQGLFKDYAGSLSLESLVFGLEYLSRAELDAHALSGIKKIRIFHGGEDAIASLAEAETLKVCLPQAEFIRLPGAGHALFLSPEFKEKFAHG